MTTYTFNGVTYDDADLTGESTRYSDIVTTGTGVDVPRYIAPMIDALADAGKILATTSTSSVAIGTGSKAFVMVTERAYSVGQWVISARTSAPTTTYMVGQVTANSGGTLTVDVDSAVGTGTHTDWTISVTGEPNDTVGDDTVSTAKIQDLAVTTAKVDDLAITTGKVANDAITYAKMQNVSTTDRLLGRSTAGAGDVEEITCTSFARSVLDDTTASAARTTLGIPTAMVELLYPVGSIYMNKTNSTNPGTLFGVGTWVALEDVMVIGASGTYAAGSTGGSATTTQTSSTLVAHKHSLDYRGQTAGDTHNTSFNQVPGVNADVVTTTDSDAVGNTGSGNAMTTISPYVAAYMWERTA